MSTRYAVALGACLVALSSASPTTATPFSRSIYSASEAGFEWFRVYSLISKAGAHYLWPVSLKVDKNGNQNVWHKDAHDILESHKGQWIRIEAKQGVAGYTPVLHRAKLDLPTFPNGGMKKLIAIAFKGKVIDSPDHIIMRDLDGLES